MIWYFDIYKNYLIAIIISVYSILYHCHFTFKYTLYLTSQNFNHAKSQMTSICPMNTFFSRRHKTKYYVFTLYIKKKNIKLLSPSM